MKKWWLLVISTIIFAAITGCSGGETTKEEKKENKPAASQSSEEKKTFAVNIDATGQLNEYLDTNFSMTTWYPHIKVVEIEENKAVVHIDTNDQEIAKKIAMSIWGWTNAHNNKLKLDVVELLDPEGQTVFIEENPLK
ncbi:hypothetical protein [Thermaerobacillus caldiproteolyticus]|uniref:hypothetical protein n=1 Tax=Thermaerobacillus caldiproteolyticus TaxID=247480 RepID=UPI0018F139DD|nr:hypothetical protein [Anoxybacillus caldiproteolyticus]